MSLPACWARQTSSCLKCPSRAGAEVSAYNLSGSDWSTVSNPDTTVKFVSPSCLCCLVTSGQPQTRSVCPPLLTGRMQQPLPSSSNIQFVPPLFLLIHPTRVYPHPKGRSACHSCFGFGSRLQWPQGGIQKTASSCLFKSCTDTESHRGHRSLPLGAQLHLDVCRTHFVSMKVSEGSGLLPLAHLDLMHTCH